MKKDFTLSETTSTVQDSCSAHGIKVKMQKKISYIKICIFVRNSWNFWVAGLILGYTVTIWKNVSTSPI